MGSLLKLSGIKRFLKGQVIATGSDAGSDSMFIMLQGTAGAYENYRMLNEQQTAAYEAGGFFGEMSLFLGRKREATFVALTDVITLEVSKMNAFEVFSKLPEITFSLLEGLCKRIDAMSEARHALRTEEKESAPRIFISASSPLFPEEHGQYILPIDNSKSGQLFLETVKCPICRHSFTNLTVLESKLVQQSKDADQRIRYQDIEPIYYEVVTCPACLYSAMSDLFKGIEVTKRMSEALADAIMPYKGSVEIQEGAQRDTFTIFAGYYLAILEAPQCFHEYQRITARLWRNLSRIYDDCSDDQMMRYALQKSADEYMYAYSNFDIGGKPLQQLCYVIGEISYKLGDLQRARQFLYAAFTNKEGTPVVKRQAEDRLDEIKRVLNT
ncbi:MAG: DUF2225 domain-containing protein [Clostridiales Family XIII bacterium]|nr:DUF2225 domain-containing protein [Clostridiales Family XIII bacterium]